MTAHHLLSIFKGSMILNFRSSTGYFEHLLCFLSEILAKSRDLVSIDFGQELVVDYFCVCCDQRKFHLQYLLRQKSC